MTDEKFAEKAEKFTLLKSTDGTFYTIEEYKEKIKAAQTDKDDNLVILYANNKEANHQFIQNANDRG